MRLHLDTTLLLSLTSHILRNSPEVARISEYYPFCYKRKKKQEKYVYFLY